MVNESKSKNIHYVNKNVNEYTTRTHTCGQLRLSNVGEEVQLFGWVEFVRMDKFILIRDAYGTTQILTKELASLL